MKNKRKTKTFLLHKDCILFRHCSFFIVLFELFNILSITQHHTLQPKLERWRNNKNMQYNILLRSPFLCKMYAIGIWLPLSFFVVRNAFLLSSYMFSLLKKERWNSVKDKDITIDAWFFTHLIFLSCHEKRKHIRINTNPMVLNHFLNHVQSVYI